MAQIWASSFKSAFSRFAQIFAVGEKRIHIGSKVAIDPAERFSIARPSRENILQRKTVVAKALRAIALRDPASSSHAPPPTGKRVTAEHRPHPIMK